MNELESTVATPQAQEPFPGPGEETLTQPDTVAVGRETRPSRDRLRLLREIVETVLLTLVIFGAINVLTGRFRIEGPSMEPNLHGGQYLIISKVIYRLHPPRRGDIIVFHHPRNPNRDLIKRVVGLPSETVEIRQGQVYIDDAHLKEPYVAYPGRYSVRYELGADDFFVLGDNRPNSDDSHSWGVLKRDQIVGKAWISYWPPGEWGGVPHYGFSEDTAAQGPAMEVENR